MAIHVTLVHNSAAGYDQYSKEELVNALQKKGFETTYADVKEDNFTQKLKNPGDLVIIAGGDGTVIAAAKHLNGGKTPIGLLPLGTANNIATCLGISGKPEDIIASWDLAKKKPFSLGIVKGPEGETFFLESIGFGLFPRLIRQREWDKDGKETRKEELQDALQHQLEILKDYNAHSCTINLDGKKITGRFLLVEVMNIPLTGPNMDLPPQAHPEDSFLDVVMLQESERGNFEDYLISRINGSDIHFSLPVRSAKRIEIEWEGIHFHQDDQAKEYPSPIKLDIQLVQKGLEFLAV